MRLSIEIPESQHQKIKAMASLRGLSLKEYILEKTLPPLSSATDASESEALAQLELLMAPRIAAAARREFTGGTMKDIIATARSRRSRRKGG